MSGYYHYSVNFVRLFLLTVAIYGVYGELGASSRVTHAAVRAAARSAAVVRAPALSLSVTGARAVSFDAATAESPCEVTRVSEPSPEPASSGWAESFVSRLKREDSNCIATVRGEGYEDLSAVMRRIRNQMGIVELYADGYQDRESVTAERQTAMIAHSFISDRPGMESWFDNNVRFQELLQLYKEAGESFAPNVQKSLDQFSEDVLEFRRTIFHRSKHRLHGDHDEDPRR